MTVDAQQQLDLEVAADFRRLVTRQAETIRRHKVAEAKLREAAKKAQKERKRKEAAEERAIDSGRDVPDLDFVRQLQACQREVEEAQLAESAAVNAWKEERARRKQAQGELQVTVKRFSAPVPLLDYREPDEPAPGANGVDGHAEKVGEQPRRCKECGKGEADTDAWFHSELCTDCALKGKAEPRKKRRAKK
jgi:hypothetical protein